MYRREDATKTKVPLPTSITASMEEGIIMILLAGAVCSLLCLAFVFPFVNYGGGRGMDRKLSFNLYSRTPRLCRGEAVNSKRCDITDERLLR